MGSKMGSGKGAVLLGGAGSRRRPVVKPTVRPVVGGVRAEFAGGSGSRVGLVVGDVLAKADELRGVARVLGEVGDVVEGVRGMFRDPTIVGVLSGVVGGVDEGAVGCRRVARLLDDKVDEWVSVSNQGYRSVGVPSGSSSKVPKDPVNGLVVPGGPCSVLMKPGLEAARDVDNDQRPTTVMPLTCVPMGSLWEQRRQDEIDVLFDPGLLFGPDGPRYAAAQARRVRNNARVTPTLPDSSGGGKKSKRSKTPSADKAATPTQTPATNTPAGSARGAERAAEYSGNWQTASLSEKVAEFAGPNPTVTSSASGKTIYTNPANGMQVVYDKAGNYFTMFDKEGNYLMLNGTRVPANVPILTPNGGYAMSGVPKDVRKGLTHFNATP